MHYLQHRRSHSLLGLTIISILMLGTIQANAAESNTDYGTNALSSNTTGNDNSAFGDSALKFNNIGIANTAVGSDALYRNANGVKNTGIGRASLRNNTSGSNNSAVGYATLYMNSTGYENTATGYSALRNNDSGYENTAMGTNALSSNIDGRQNVAVGKESLSMNTSGNINTVIGSYALLINETGSANTAIGPYTLYYNKKGSHNIALGFDAGFDIIGSDNIDIGNNGASSDYGVIRIGTVGRHIKTYIAGISGRTASGGVQVYINDNGQLGTLTSSARFKKDISAIDSVSNKLLNLRPVSFVYKDDEHNSLQYGLIAEEVAKVFPELVQLDEEGNPFTVYYHLLTPLLLSALQKEHELNDAQQTKLIAQQTEIASLNQQLQDQRAEMLAALQTQRADMVAMQQNLSRMDTLLQATNATKSLPEKVALITSK